MECYYCRDRMVRVRLLTRWMVGVIHLLIDDVPAWVCGQCGEVYFEGDEVDAIQDLVKTLDSKIVKGRLVKPK